jgi:hypothetical protein
MRRLVLIVAATLSLAACAGPSVNGSSDSTQSVLGGSHATAHTGPYDNTANSLGGRYVGGGD